MTDFGDFEAQVAGLQRATGAKRLLRYVLVIDTLDNGATIQEGNIYYPPDLEEARRRELNDALGPVCQEYAKALATKIAEHVSGSEILTVAEHQGPKAPRKRDPRVGRA